MPQEEPVQEGEIPSGTVEEKPLQEAVGEKPLEETVAVNGETSEPSGGVDVATAATGTENIPTVSDPALVDIDKLVEGQELFEPEEEEEMADTKHGKKDKKKKCKDPALEAVNSALKLLPPEEQVATVLEKYTEVAESNRQLQAAVKTIKKQVENIQREKESMESEHSKVVLTKARLESLCRELQKQNKIIKDENISRLKEEEERRKEVSAKFNTTLSEISNLMKENSDKNTKLRDENQDMAGRLQDLVNQYESRESHVEKILKTKDLQCQLVEAKLAKQHIEVTEYKEQMLIEKKGLLEDIGSYQGKLQTMSENEISLRMQLNSYMEKYEEFQTTLDRSNKIFNTFKKEMDDMTKKIKKLEKETKTWKERWEGANKALLDMVTERSEQEKKMETQVRQNVQLQNLCRALQQEVTELRNKNKTSSSSSAVQADILNEELDTKEVDTGSAMSKAKEELAKPVPEVSLCESSTDEVSLVDDEASKEGIQVAEGEGNNMEAASPAVNGTTETDNASKGTTEAPLQATDYSAID